MDDFAFYDLHAHTTASDGALSPAELVLAAKSQNLRALAVTDHDTVEGIDEARRQAHGVGIELVPGVEISANFRDVPVHVLGLFVADREPWLREFFAEAGRRRIDRIRQIVSKLRKLGIDIELQAVLARSSHGTVGRPHVAEVLVDLGVVPDLTEAFTRFLGQDGPAYVGYEKVTLKDATDLVRRAGGVASLAHPVLLEDDSLIPEMAEELHALEVYHEDHTPVNVKRYEKLAEELGLLKTGGSDFHRAEDGEPPQLGCARLTEEAFEKIRAAAR